jgi:RNA polymerase sigma-70 factor, ECF subfamily
LENDQRQKITKQLLCHVRVNVNDDPTPNDALSVASVFRSHLRFVWRVLHYQGVRSADVQDMAQEVFVIVHRRFAEFKPGTSMRSWLYAICWHVASQHRRRSPTRREVPLELDALLAPTQTPEQRVGSKRRLELLNKAMSALNESQQLVFFLYEVEGMEMQEVAEAVGCPLQTGYTRLHAARARVKALFGAAGEEVFDG